jgi:hypothetical protein
MKLLNSTRIKRSSKMLRRFVLALTIVLLAAAGASADIIQLQDYIIGASNGILLDHGHQHGEGSHTICVNNNQCAEKICGAFAHQDQTALLNQIGSAVGHCAVMAVGQTFDALAGQTQAIGDCVEPMLQGQDFGLIGTQLVSKSEGEGMGGANQMFAGSQNQVAGNPIGGMRESSAIGAFENAALAGSAGSTGVVTNGMSVSTLQAQAID